MTHDNGTAGGSARREGARRKAKDDAQTLEKWGRFGKVAVTLTPEKTNTRVWTTGAIGEEMVGRHLDKIASDTVRVLHDRRIPRTKRNIDHIVVTPAGVWVVDSKRYSGPPSLSVSGGLFGPRIEKLMVAGRDKSMLVDKVLEQVGFVNVVVPDVPVRGILCFVDSGWPLLPTSFRMKDVEVLWPGKLLDRLRKTVTAQVDVGLVSGTLSAHFPPA